MTQYRALTGIDYPPDKRVEAGDMVSDLPEKSAKWLLDQGLIELPDGKTFKAEPVIEVVPEVIYDSKAADGDKDGFVQDGTEFQRLVEEKE